LGVERKASDLTLENISCCEVSNRDSWMDLSKTTFITSKEDDVCDDLKVLKARNCKELAKDRNVWNDLSEKAKTHKGL
jgi:CRISPR/Cas system type I-B associated protein Csh2 (Cas7 group RAMP superfamily)